MDLYIINLFQTIICHEHDILLSKQTNGLQIYFKNQTQANKKQKQSQVQKVDYILWGNRRNFLEH